MKLMKAMLLLAAAAVTVPAIAQTTSYSYRITYYSDASKTTVVGREIALCSGDTVTSGEQTPFFTEQYGNCP